MLARRLETTMTEEVQLSGKVRVDCLVQTLGDVPQHDEWLSPGELATFARLRFAKRRTDWRLGRWTAKRALSNHLAGGEIRLFDLAVLEIRAAPDGAPEPWLAGHPLPVSLSISHSSGLGFAAIAAAGTALGCDLERVEKRGPTFVADYFTAQEAARIDRAAEEDRAFWATLLWSAKESVLKALRTGLRLDTRAVEINLPESLRRDGWQPFGARQENRLFSGRWRQIGGCVATLAAA